MREHHGSEAYERAVDPDVDLHVDAQRHETDRGELDLLLACSAGGVLGAWARCAIGRALPHPAGGFPWSTVLINVSGCLLIGALMVVLLELTTPHRLARPFLGVGLLGGYTTYSTFAVDAERLLLAHRAGLALGYVAATVVGGALAVWLSTSVTLRLGRGS
jgi:CrcB protein